MDRILREPVDKGGVHRQAVDECNKLHGRSEPKAALTPASGVGFGCEEVESVTWLARVAWVAELAACVDVGYVVG